MPDFSSSDRQSEAEILTPKIQDKLSVWEDERDLEAHRLAQLEGLAKLMDAQFNIPFLPIPIGLDTLIGLIQYIYRLVDWSCSNYRRSFRYWLAW